MLLGAFSCEEDVLTMPPPDAPQTAVDTAQAAQPTPPPIAPADPTSQPAVGATGQPLTAASSLADLLAEPAPSARPAQAVLDVDGALGRSVASVQPVLAEPAPPLLAEAQPAQDAAPVDAPEPSGETAPTADDAPAADEPAAAVFDEDITIQQLTAQKLGLLREQGRKNQELGDLRSEVRRLSEIIEQQASRPPQSAMPDALPPDEELAARFLDKPSQYLMTPSQFKELARQEAATLIQTQAAAWQEQQVAEAYAVAPQVADGLFAARHGIQDLVAWQATDEGKAVIALFAPGTDRQRLMQARIDDADVRGIESVMSKALQAHRLGKKAAQGRHAVNGEKARIDASRPPSTPVRPAAPPPPAPAAKSLYAKDFSEADLMDFMRGAESWERD